MAIKPRGMAWKLREILSDFHPKRGVEIGVWRGRTSQYLLHSFPELTLHLVDPYRPYGFMFKEGWEPEKVWGEARQRTDHFRDRRLFHVATSAQAVKLFSPGSLDFAFIDGSHLYEDVWHDCNAWWPKIRPGGILIGHDYRARRTRGYPRKAWSIERGGVKKAVDEWITQEGLQLHIFKPHMLWWAIKPNTPSSKL